MVFLIVWGAGYIFQNALHKASLLMGGNGDITLRQKTNNGDGTYTHGSYMCLKGETDDIAFVLANEGNVGIGTETPSEKLELAGKVKATQFVTSSDECLKENIQTVSGLEKILKLRGVTFNWKDSEKADVGVIAQEIEKVFPELVVTDEKTGMKAVSYSSLVGPLIEATKSQQELIVSQQEQIDALILRIEALEAT